MSEIIIDQGDDIIVDPGDAAIILDVPVVIQADGGDVFGPAGAADNVPAVFDGTTGKLIKEPDAAIDFLGQDVTKTGNISIGPDAPATDAQLDMQRTDGALLPPRLTTAQRDALTPAASMVIYNTTVGEPQIYDGSAWRKLDQDFEAFAAPLIPTGTAQTIDFATGRNKVIDLASATGDVTLTLNSPTAGVVYTVKVIQGATARDLVWPGSVLWPGGTAPVISTGDDDIDIVQLFYDGTNYLGLFSQDFS